MNVVCSSFSLQSSVSRSSRMITAFDNNIGHYQTYGRHNLNFSDANISSPYQYNLESVTPVVPHRPSPKYPQYNSLSDRLSTFRSWSLARPGPIQLAQEGFYYTGDKDQTVCYYCGVRLSSWNPEDDPEKEHEHWYPDCELVKRRKQNANSSTKSISVSKQELHQEDPMKSTAVQSVIEYGYTPEIIKMAVDRLTKQKGTNVFNAVELMEILDNFDDNEKSDKDLSDPAKPSECEKRSETGNCTDSSLSSSLLSSVSSSNEVKRIKFEEDKKLDAKTLKEENQRLIDMTLCKICMDQSSCVVFLPCGHMVCCASCSPAMRKCPICRVLVRATVKAFMA